MANNLKCCESSSFYVHIIPSTQVFEKICNISFGDNTSPRFVPLLMNQFLVVYGKKPNLKFAGPPGFHSHGGALQFLLDHSHDLRSFSLCLHGQPRKPSNDICQCNLDIIHTNPHHLIGQVVSIIITSLQFDSTLNVNLTDFPTNLVPYPHIYFPRATYSQASQLRRPIVSSKIISACLKLASQMAKYDLPQQVHGLWHVVLEGQANINTAFTSNRMKRNTQFVDVAQLDLKWTSTTSPLIIIPRGDLAKEQQSVGVLSNTTAMAEVWACLNRERNEVVIGYLVSSSYPPGQGTGSPVAPHRVFKV
ncbi:tubulin alpha chain-like [Meles meles]|uniref:tubulin alpha chain-like n=1 Tax=Meles meles TaxID=9662 RepID=UPI001E6993A2|nr:tubulin alpha chain-like [Meles meles]